MDYPPTAPQFVQEQEVLPEKDPAGPVVIAARATMFLVLTAIVLEISGRVHPERDWILGERPFTLRDALAGAWILGGSFLFALFLAICFFRRARGRALKLAALAVVGFVLAVPLGVVMRSSSPACSGLSAWAASVNTTPVNTWLASNPAATPSTATPFALFYVQDSSALSRASSIAVTSVPRYDSGRLPDEVLLLPANDAIFAVYHTGWRSSRIVIIGPAAMSIPPHFHPSCIWTTVRPDLVVGEFDRS